jgi:hypothetical protein
MNVFVLLGAAERLVACIAYGCVLNLNGSRPLRQTKVTDRP